MKTILFLLFFLHLNYFFAQDKSFLEPVTDKVVIGFPGITTTQLNQIKNTFLNYDQITSAYFVYGTYNCMFIKLNNSYTTFKQFYDLVKITGFDAEKCYLKPYPDYDFGEQNIGTTPTFVIKP